MDLLGFITLGITPLEARVAVLTIIAWVAHRYGQLYLHCSLIYFWVPSSCFCILISLSEGEIIWSAVSPLIEAIIHAGGGGGFTRLTDCFDDTDRRRPAATSSHRASFSALASANSFVYFASSAAASRWRHLHVSNCRVRQLPVLWHFCRAGLCR